MSEQNKNEQIDTYTKWQHEREMTRIELQCKRWFIFAMVLLSMLFGTNFAWVIYENQFEEVSYSQEVDNGNGNAAVSLLGDVEYNGED